MDLTESSLAFRLARSRWGPTGFRCPTCGHERAWVLRSRPRIRTCRGCRRQVSVTAGTVLEHSRLPLRAWFVRGGWYDAGALPSSRGLAAELDVAPSSAWHLNQRFLAHSLPVTPPPLLVGIAVLTFKVRRPSPTPPLSPDAPAGLQEMTSRFLRRGARPPYRVTPTVAVSEDPVWVHDACPTPEQAQQSWRERPALPAIAHRHLGLERWLRVQLEGALRTVSPRWLQRYLDHLLMLHSAHLVRERPPPWLGLLQLPPCPLARLRPFGVSPG